MSLDTFVAGRYSNTYNSVDTGITDDNGYVIQQDSAAQLINATDAYGDTVIDWVYRGGNCFLQFTSDAYKAGSITPFWPWGALGTLLTAAAPIGRLASAVASADVLTAIANTPASAAPASVTATLAILAPNSPANLMYNSKLRTVPVRLQILPSNSSGTFTWFA